MTSAPYRAMPEQNLKRNTWYYGARCGCGLQIVVHEDFSQGYGDDFLELPKPIPVECHCGTVSHAQRFQKFRTP